MTILKVTPIENPKVLNKAYSYGSAFSRGTKVEIEQSPISNIAFYFVSGTASVNKKGKSVNVGDLGRQIRRMVYNIEGVLEGGDGEENIGLDSIVTRTTYVKGDVFDKAKQIVSQMSEHIKSGTKIWVPANICRKDLLIETDALAVHAINTPPYDLWNIINRYQQFQSMAMKWKPTNEYSYKININDLYYLFIFDYAETFQKNDIVLSNIFRNELQNLYKRITKQLETHRATWQDVVNTRINLPQLLAMPPDMKQEGIFYYKIFNDVRTDFFKNQGVDPYPSSTCVGAIGAPENLLIAMSVLAIYKFK